jgi:hypothetical protein
VLDNDEDMEVGLKTVEVEVVEDNDATTLESNVSPEVRRKLYDLKGLIMLLQPYLSTEQVQSSLYTCGESPISSNYSGNQNDSNNIPSGFGGLGWQRFSFWLCAAVRLPKQLRDDLFTCTSAQDRVLRIHEHLSADSHMDLLSQQNPLYSSIVSLLPTEDGVASAPASASTSASASAPASVPPSVAGIISSAEALRRDISETEISMQSESCDVQSTTEENRVLRNFPNNISEESFDQYTRDLDSPNPWVSPVSVGGGGGGRQLQRNISLTSEASETNTEAAMNASVERMLHARVKFVEALIRVMQALPNNDSRKQRIAKFLSAQANSIFSVGNPSFIGFENSTIASCVVVFVIGAYWILNCYAWWTETIPYTTKIVNFFYIDALPLWVYIVQFFSFVLLGYVIHVVTRSL